MPTVCKPGLDVAAVPLVSIGYAWGCGLPLVFTVTSKFEQAVFSCRPAAIRPQPFKEEQLREQAADACEQWPLAAEASGCQCSQVNEQRSDLAWKVLRISCVHTDFLSCPGETFRGTMASLQPCGA